MRTLEKAIKILHVTPLQTWDATLSEINLGSLGRLCLCFQWSPLFWDLCALYRGLHALVDYAIYFSNIYSSDYSLKVVLGQIGNIPSHWEDVHYHAPPI
ncbi:hypothetical protein Taro_009099 [Colocasia esculenta]|uniref:Uncharacterized protein n=1 Tax=Colocasia esculenta TaxID=4460 RepID=A0A843TZC7_COLES|nr:hypothetical protein [Colocasia esculenta]